MAPSLVTYFQVRLNLGVAADKEIYVKLQAIPARQRSAIAKTALLAYFRGQHESTGREARTAQTTSIPEEKIVDPSQIETTATVKITEDMPMQASRVDNNATGGENEEKLKGLLSLIQ